MISWKRLRKNIPKSVKVLKRAYEILWTDDLVSGSNHGETRFDPAQIVLHNSPNSKEVTYTFMHEFFHAVSYEYDIGLTESQVLKLEKALPDMIKIIKELDQTRR